MSSSFFLWFRKYPKLYVWGCGLAVNENESHYRPPYGLRVFALRDKRQNSREKIVKYYQKIICSKVLTVGLDL
jgi:hypothetical protein